MARIKAHEAKDRAVESDWLMPLVGAGIGALLGKAVLERMQDRHYRDERRSRAGHAYPGGGYAGTGGYAGYGGPGDRYAGYAAPYGGSAGWDRTPRQAADTYVEQVEIWAEAPAGGSASGLEGGALEGGAEDRGGEYQRRAAEMKDRASGKVDELRHDVAERASEYGHRAAEMKERLVDRAGAYGERLRHGAEDLRHRMPDREALRESAAEQAGLWAIGALAVGALFGFAVPMSRKEREVLEPARRKVREATEQAKEMALEKGSEALDQAEERVEAQGEGSEDQPSSRGEGARPGALPFEPLH